MKLLLECREAIAMALDAIRANKLRSALATLGIVIGIVTVTLMGTAIAGLNAAFLRSISFLGADVFHVSRRGWFNHTYADWLKEANRPRISMAQVRAVTRELTQASAVAPWVETRRPVAYKSRSSTGVSIIGTTDQFLYTGGFTLGDGRFLTDAECEGGRPVCVVGADVAERLFPNEVPLGTRIRVGGHPFEVVGVLAKQGKMMGQFSLDNQVLVPVRQFVEHFWSDPDFTLQVKAQNLAQLDDAREELRGVLRKVRRVQPGAPDNFAINQQEMFIATFLAVAGTIAAVGGFITSLSLFVGGIGVMNIMYVSVAERTREIGIRKAIGAKRRAILIQFLAEAAGLCLFAGLLGLAIAWPLTLLVQQFIPATMSLNVAAAAIFLALATGIAAGFLPAWRAARMNPVDALRQE